MDRDMTFAAARERVVREWPGARFVEQAAANAPVLWITRGPAGKGPYRVTIAIAVEQVSPARVRIVPYALGTATRVVPRAALFVCECDWCGKAPSRTPASAGRASRASSSRVGTPICGAIHASLAPSAP